MTKIGWREDGSEWKKLDMIAEGKVVRCCFWFWNLCFLKFFKYISRLNLVISPTAPIFSTIWLANLALSILFVYPSFFCCSSVLLLFILYSLIAAILEMYATVLLITATPNM